MVNQNADIAFAVIIALASLACFIGIVVMVRKSYRDSRDAERQAEEIRSAEAERRCERLRIKMKEEDERAEANRKTRSNMINEADRIGSSVDRVLSGRQTPTQARKQLLNDSYGRVGRRRDDDSPAAGSIFPDFTPSMPAAPSPSFEPGGGSSGGGGASSSWDSGSCSSSSSSSSSDSSSSSCSSSSSSSDSGSSGGGPD